MLGLTRLSNKNKDIEENKNLGSNLKLHFLKNNNNKYIKEHAKQK